MIRLIISLLSIILTILFNKPVYIGLILSTLIFYFSSLYYGYSPKTLNKFLMEGVLSSKNVIFVLSLIGILTSLWMACGTIPYLMFLGLGILKKYNFILFSFLIMSTISYVLGTAVGSISTIGVVLIGIGNAVGIDTAILAGTIVSGAFLGDRSSPLSSCLNLTIEMTNSSFSTTHKHLNRTLIPAFILCCIIYFFIGKQYSNLNTSKINASISMLSSNFNLTVYCLIPVIVLFVFILLRFNICKCIILSIISGFIVGNLVENANILYMLKTSLFGYKSSHLNAAQGGLFSMYKIILTIIAATMFSKLLQELNILDSLIETLQNSAKNSFNLIIKTGFLSFLLNTLTCSQIIGIIIPAVFMRDYFKKHSLSNEVLAHTISDFGNITVCLIPWNINSIVASIILGVSSLKFIPYAFLCYTLPIIFLINIKLKGDD